MTFKVKGQGRKFTSSRNASDRCWPISQERNVLETPKLVERLHTPRAIMHSSVKAKVAGDETLMTAEALLAISERPSTSISRSVDLVMETSDPEVILPLAAR